MRKIMLLAGLWFAAAYPANAYCVQKTYAVDFAGSVDNTFQYLLCLHNDQVDSLNRHADALNKQAREIENLKSDIIMLRMEVDRLKTQ